MKQYGTAAIDRPPRSLYRRVLWTTCRSEARRRLLVIVLVQFLVGAFTIAELQLLRRTVETLQTSPGLTADGSKFLALLITLHLVGGFANALSMELRTPIAESIHRAVSLELVDTAANVSLDTLDDPEFHNRLQRIVGKSEDRIWGTVFAGINLLNLGAITIAVGIALATLAPIVLPAALLSVVPLWIAFHKNTEATHDLSHRLTQSDRRREYLERTLASRGAAKEVRVFDLGPFFSQKIADEFDFRKRAVTQIMRSRIGRIAISNLITGLCIGGGLFIILFASREKPLGNGVLAASALALYQLLGRLRSIATTAENLQQGRLFLNDYAEFVTTARLQPRQSSDGPEPKGPLAIEDVSYSYPDSDRPAISNVSLRVPVGAFVAIVGDNGSGKSTLVKLICGLIKPNSGTIDIGGTSIQDLGHPMPVVLSAMFQDYVRYELSLDDNVTLADWQSRSHDEDNSSVRVKTAVKSAGLEQVAARLPNGYGTILSRSFTDGTELSIGQWQRVALARALFRRGAFLVLDEPTASLDALSEEALLCSLNTLRSDRGIILITHRLSTARRADEILFMHEGRIAERGSHEELIELNGLYATRFRVQAQSYESSVA